MENVQSSPERTTGLLKSRPPGLEPAGQPTAGLQWLDVGLTRKPALFAPGGIQAGQAMPLVVLLHGAGGDAAGILPAMHAEAEQQKFLLLAPQSAGRTWDIILGSYGPDVEVLDRALAAVFGAYAVDRDRIAIAGFSDGASYALSVGLMNGGLFSDILAFSPGFAAPQGTAGKPRVFISHGRQDAVLPVERCSRRIVRNLSSEGYPVDYREFDGGHVMPPDMVRAALQRFLDR